MSAAYDPADIKARHSLTEEVARCVNLRRSGREMVGLCPFHQEKTPSFTVVEDRGFYHCFGCGAHGDVIDFVASYHNTDFPGACAILDGERQSSVRPMPRAAKPKPPALIPAPIPADHRAFSAGDQIRAWNPKQERWGTYTPDRVFPYRSAGDGTLLSYVIRIDLAADDEAGRPSDEKIILPLRCALVEGRPHWVVQALDEPRPLYGLPQLAAHPGASVFLVEGEGKADQLAALMGVPCLSWPGGTNGPPHADFAPLRGRNVIVWADADKVGDQAAVAAAMGADAAGASSVLVVPWDKSRPAGWDCADAIREGWDADAVWDYVDEGGTQPLFEAPQPEPLPAPSGDFDANPFTGELPPPRPWAFGRILMNRTVTALAAPPGTGKSTWALQLAIAFSQHARLGPFDPIRTGPVWVWNNEEDGDELNRRVLASCAAMNVQPAKLAGRLYLNSGADRALIVAREDRRSGEIIATPDVARVIEVINERAIRLLIIDPFAETFEVESENSNDAMKRVAKLYRDIAWATGCAVLLSAHTPKGTNADRSAGDLDAIRGGGAIGGVLRSAWTMFEMTEDDAASVGIPDASKHLYVRLDAAKANMSLRDSEPVWWRKEGVPLGNAADGFDQDIVGAFVHQQFTPIAAKKAEEDTARLDRVSAEIIRVCEEWGWTSADQATALDTVAGALDRIKTGLSVRAVKDLVIGQMGYSHNHDDHTIEVTQTARGTLTIRKIYVVRRPSKD